MSVNEAIRVSGASNRLVEAALIYRFERETAANRNPDYKLGINGASKCILARHLPDVIRMFYLP